MERFRKEVMARGWCWSKAIFKAARKVVHLVAEKLFDRSRDLVGLANDALSRKHAVPVGPALIEPLNDDRREHPDHPAQKSAIPATCASCRLAGFSLGHNNLDLVMAGLDPAIHQLQKNVSEEGWIRGSSRV